MALTPRQKVLLAEFIDFFNEEQKPISYKDIAKRLGISNSTAYEMLRKFEHSGGVIAVYEPSTDEKKRGRARVLFKPGRPPLDTLRQLGNKEATEANWVEIKNELLTLLDNGKELYPGVLEDMQFFLNKVAGSTLLTKDQCTEITPALILADLESFVISSLFSDSKQKARRTSVDLLSTVTPKDAPLIKCAQIIAALTIPIALNIQSDAKNIWLQIINETSQTREGLILLVGVMLGSFSNQKGELININVYQRYVHLFEQALLDLIPEEIKTIYNFILVLYEKIFITK
jgi:DNA-binding Lrp family transcriptional regulator